MPKPRIRSIKPDLADSEKVARLSDEAFRVFICAITQADDAGSFPASDGHMLRFLGFRGEPRRFAAVRGELSKEGFVVFYTVRGSTFGRIHDWADHQRIDNARKDPSEYYPNPQDGVAVTRFPTPTPVPAAVRGRSRRAAETRGDSPPPAAGLEGIGEERMGEEGDLPPPAAGAPVLAVVPSETAKTTMRDAIKQVADLWYELHEERTGQKPIWTKDQKGMVFGSLKRLVEACARGGDPAVGADEVCRRSRILFTAPPPFLASSVPDIPTLVQHFEKLAAPSQRRPTTRSGSAGISPEDMAAEAQALMAAERARGER